MTDAMSRRIKATEEKPATTEEQRLLELERKRAAAKARGQDYDDDTTVAQAVPMA